MSAKSIGSSLLVVHDLGQHLVENLRGRSAQVCAPPEQPHHIGKERLDHLVGRDEAWHVLVLPHRPVAPRLHKVALPERRQVAVWVVAQGDVADYTPTVIAGVANSVASTLDVDVTAVSVNVTAASVLISVSIAVADASAQATITSQ